MNGLWKVPVKGQLVTLWWPETAKMAEETKKTAAGDSKNEGKKNVFWLLSYSA